jgi:hypothetical protein
MIKLNNTNRRALTWIAVLIIAILVLGTMSSGYVGAPIVIKQDLEGSFWDLKQDLACTPGHVKGAAYSRGGVPGGLCGDQQWVRQSATYEIVDE